MDDHELSVMEDLDPEPSGRARSVRTREVWLGVLLLLGVLGWAGWQWWQGEAQRNNYELGSRAVIAQRWDEARAHFQAADGYKDASTRAQDAEKKIEERDRQYELASVHADAGEWIVALKAAQAVATIQPHYKDLDALTAEAQRQVYRQGLDGIIVRRVLDDPGLYYRDGDVWVRLENSDQWSDVRGYGRDGTVIYDVPSPGWVHQPSPTPTTVPGLPPMAERGSPELAGRQLMSASFQGDGGPIVHRLSLDPARFNYYTVAKAGVWGVSFSNSANRYPGLRIQGTFAGTEIEYEAYGSGRTSSIGIAPNAALLDSGAEGKHILYVEFDAKAPGTGGMKLYVAGPDGTEPRLIYTTTGGISSARLSPDERFVAISTVEHTEGSNGKMAALLLDLQGDAKPRTLIEAGARIMRTPTSLRWEDPFDINAFFLRRGQFANKVIVWVSDPRSGTQVKLIDPEHPPWSRTLADVPSASVYLPIYEQAGGNALVILAARMDPMNGPVAGRPVTATLSIAEYDVALAQWTYVPVRVTDHAEVVLSLAPNEPRASWDFTGFTLAGDHLVYVGLSFNPSFTTIFYSMPLADLNRKEPRITELLKVAQEQGSRFAYPSCFPGPDLFVYTGEQHALHARTYDGAIDLVLERGVDLIRGNWFYGY